MPLAYRTCSCFIPLNKNINQHKTVPLLLATTCSNECPPQSNVFAAYTYPYQLPLGITPSQARFCVILHFQKVLRFKKCFYNFSRGFCLWGLLTVLLLFVRDIISSVLYNYVVSFQQFAELVENSESPLTTETSLYWIDTGSDGLSI